ncbi:MAG: hypothetical protein ACREPR_26425 [Brasilonema sp.]
MPVRRELLQQGASRFPLGLGEDPPAGLCGWLQKAEGRRKEKVFGLLFMLRPILVQALGLILLKSVALALGFDWMFFNQWRGSSPH